MNFAKFVGTPFLQNISGRLLLLRLHKILLHTTSYKPPHLKQHRCSNSLCETGNKWLICKNVYMELSGGWNELFWDTWLVLVSSLIKTCCFQKQERTLWMGFCQSCFCTIFILINNLHMQNETYPLIEY